MIKIHHSFKSSRRLNLGREKKKVIYGRFLYICVEVEGKKAVFGLQPP